MNRRTLLSCFATSSLALLLAPVAVWAAPDTSSLEGKPAPEVSLKTLDGKEMKLSELKGHVVVLDFWATWCPPCRKSLPHLNKVAADQSLTAKGLKVFAVNCKEPPEKVKAFLDKNDLHFNVPLDSDGATMQGYLISGIPTTVVVGRDGVIRNVFIGFGGESSEQELDSAIRKALSDPRASK